MFGLQGISQNRHQQQQQQTRESEEAEETEDAAVVVIGEDDDDEDEDDNGRAAKRRKSELVGVVEPSSSSGVGIAPSSSSSSSRGNKIPTVECKLTSVNQLRNDVEEAKHGELEQILKNHVFVACVDIPSSLSLIQHATKLYLVNHASLASVFPFSWLPHPPTRRAQTPFLNLAEKNSSINSDCASLADWDV
jgi:hypothetical protein